MNYKIELPLYFNFPIRISTNCPRCNHIAVFESLYNEDVLSDGYYYIVRKCPNENCHGPLFVIYSSAEDKIVQKYPLDNVTFNEENLPTKVRNALQEVLVCHSIGCYMAAAIMIRKTIEEMCVERGAVGSNLLNKLNDISNKIMIPKELIEGMNELRLLGNDAAHVKSSSFEDIGSTEIEVSIKFTKEILKAVYQYESLLEQIRSLKKS